MSTRNHRKTFLEAYYIFYERRKQLQKNIHVLRLRSRVGVDTCWPTGIAQTNNTVPGAYHTYCSRARITRPHDLVVGLYYQKGLTRLYGSPIRGGKEETARGKFLVLVFGGTSEGKCNGETTFQQRTVYQSYSYDIQ